MSATFFLPPRDMSEAKATLTTPAIHNGHPAIIQDAWFFLAEARGLRVNRDRLHPAHDIERAAPTVLPTAPTINAIDEARVSSIPLIRRIIGNRGMTPKGVA